MQTRQLVIQGAFGPHVDLAPLQHIQPHLALVFGTETELRRGALVQALAEALPDTLVMGCSAAGAVTEEGVHEDACVVTAVRFREARLRAASEAVGSMARSGETGKRLACQLAAPDLRMAIVLAPGVRINGTQLLEGMQSVLGEDFPLSGGLAGDDGRFCETLTILGTEIASDRAVALGFYGDDVRLRSASRGGWEPFGPIRKITSSEGNLLHTLDEEPALDVYRRYLGDWAKELPASALLFPFALYRKDLSETHVVRTILGVDESRGSLILAGNAPKDGFVRLMHASSSGLLEGAQGAAEDVHRQDAPEGERLALVFSCIGRKLVLGGRVDEEAEAAASVLGPRTRLAGFHTYGEIGPLEGGTGCVLHNQTMTVTLVEDGV